MAATPINTLPSEMNQQTEELLSGIVDQKDSGAKEAFAESNRAAESAKGLLPTMENVGRQEASSGRMNQAQVSAILKKGETLFSKDLQKLVLTNKTKETTNRMQHLERRSILTRRQWSFFEELRKQKIAEEEERIAARNAVIGQVAGVAGAVAGAFVGGPAGAVAGYQVGRGMAGAAAPTRQPTQSAYNDTKSRMWEHKDYEAGDL